MKTANIETVARFLDRFEIAPLVLQSLMIGPKGGCDKSQSCKRTDDFEKQKAAKIKNGIVGINGSTTPSEPRPNAIRPKEIQNMRIFNLPTSLQ